MYHEAYHTLCALIGVGNRSVEALGEGPSLVNAQVDGIAECSDANDLNAASIRPDVQAVTLRRRVLCVESQKVLDFSVGRRPGASPHFVELRDAQQEQQGFRNEGAVR